MTEFWTHKPHQILEPFSCTNTISKPQWNQTLVCILFHCQLHIYLGQQLCIILPDFCIGFLLGVWGLPPQQILLMIGGLFSKTINLWDYNISMVCEHEHGTLVNITMPLPVPFCPPQISQIALGLNLHLCHKKPTANQPSYAMANSQSLFVATLQW